MKSGKLLLKWLKLDLKKYEKQHNRGKWQKVLLIVYELGGKEGEKATQSGKMAESVANRFFMR